MFALALTQLFGSAPGVPHRVGGEVGPEPKFVLRSSKSWSFNLPLFGVSSEVVPKVLSKTICEPQHGVEDVVVHCPTEAFVG